MAFKDQATVLFMSTVHPCSTQEGVGQVQRHRKCPPRASKAVRAPFGGQVTKWLPFPVPLDEVCFEPDSRLLKPWKALFRWLLFTTVSNCWVLWRAQRTRSGTQGKSKIGTHREFNEHVALSLLRRAKEAPEYRSRVPLSEHVNQSIGTQHYLGKLKKRGYCIACRARAVSTHSRRRVLSEVDVNSTTSGARQRPPQVATG
ncbi:hypothetical protein K402DRAFT_387684, partial [Aulographum hederae CBS 113979]